MFFDSSLFDLGMCGSVQSNRSSSYCRNGSNVDFRRIAPGESLEILSAEGPGIVTHIWFALAHPDPNYLRGLVIKAWWDGESEPSVNCPLGDFLGVGHAISNKYECSVMSMVRGKGQRGGSTGGNCYIPMPFERSAKIVVVNESYVACTACYYQVEWLKTGADAVKNAGRFHALWHRDNPCQPTDKTEYSNIIEFCRFNFNRDGSNNFAHPVIKGTGRFLGCNLSIDNIDPDHLGANLCCFNEGDEWIYIDDEKTARIRGTGTEDYFNDAWGMTGHAGLWTGTSLFEDTQKEMGKRPKGTCYRFHIPDPLYFKESFKITFEHGHSNIQANDLAITCYWYQHEPHASFSLMPVEKRLPAPEPGALSMEEERKIIAKIGAVVAKHYDIFLEGNREQIVLLNQVEVLKKMFAFQDEYAKNNSVDIDELDKVCAEGMEQFEKIM